MRRSLSFLVPSAFLLTIMALGQEWWQKKPSPEWTTEEVDRMLRALPGVSLSGSCRSWQCWLRRRESRQGGRRPKKWCGSGPP